jgi:hypothetical protein
MKIIYMLPVFILLFFYRKYNVEGLQERFGESTGMYLYDICRGIDHEEGVY